MTTYYAVLNDDGTRFIQGLLSQHVVDSFIASVEAERPFAHIYAEVEEPGIAEVITIDEAFKEIGLDVE
jgi:hypothetical protein